MDTTDFTRSKNSDFLALRCIFVDYNDDAITVTSWRTPERITKQTVLAAGLTGKLLNPKTSKHCIPDKPTDINMPLSKLK
jgi:hypothetical protein